MIPSMRRRDSVINTLLGIFLLVVFFAWLAAIVMVCWLGLMGFEWILRRIFPGVNVTAEFSLIGIWSLVMVWWVVEETRKRRWRNALLFSAVAWIMSLLFIVPTHSSIEGIRGNWVLYDWLPLIVVLSIAGNVALGRLKFVLAAVIISAVAR